MRRHASGWSAVAALLVAPVLWCSGCATEIHLRQSSGVKAESASGQLLVRVSDTRADRRRDIVTGMDVYTELYRVQGTAQTFVRVEKGPRWSVADLTPGSYLLRASRCVDERGVVQASFQPVEVGFAIRAGEIASADVVLRDPRNFWVNVLAGVVLACSIALDAEEKLGISWWPPSR